MNLKKYSLILFLISTTAFFSQASSSSEPDAYQSMHVYGKVSDYQEVGDEATFNINYGIWLEGESYQVSVGIRAGMELNKMRTFLTEKVNSMKFCSFSTLNESQNFPLTEVPTHAQFQQYEYTQLSKPDIEEDCKVETRGGYGASYDQPKCMLSFDVKCTVKKEDLALTEMNSFYVWNYTKDDYSKMADLRHFDPSEVESEKE